MSASQRLIHLLELAEQGPAMRAALAEEVAELLTSWPSDCPRDMRGACEALLARAAKEVDGDTRARLRVQLYADPDLAARVLPREGGRSVMELVRSGCEIHVALAQSAGLPRAKAADILADDSGQSLAMVCKGAGIGRAAYSALSVLAARNGDIPTAYAKLDAFDAIAVPDAVRQLHAWRQRAHAAE